MLKSYLKQDNVVWGWGACVIDFNIKFPLLILLQFLSDLKSTIMSKLKELLNSNYHICLG